jgi:hypothetical protein
LAGDTNAAGRSLHSCCRHQGADNDINGSGQLSISVILWALVICISVFVVPLCASGRDSNDVTNAALSILVREVDPHVSKYGVASGRVQQADIDANQASLEKFKGYVASVTDRSQRRALEHWVVIEQQCIDEARREFRTGAMRTEDEKSRRKYADEDRRKDAVIGTFPTPPR